MSEERRKYQPRGKKKSKMPFVLVGIVIAVGVAGFLVLKDKPGKILPDKAADAGGEGSTPEAGGPGSTPKLIPSGAPAELRSGGTVPVSTTAQVPWCSPTR